MWGLRWVDISNIIACIIKAIKKIEIGQYHLAKFPFVYIRLDNTCEESRENPSILM